ncbi:unnamed protein product, partial [Leptidea sinapis]
FLFILYNCCSRSKKVIIHVPYKVKKIKHTHLVYKTIHHHHKHHDMGLHHDIGLLPEEHEHFHHMHLHDEPVLSHSQPVPTLTIPEFLPDLPINDPLDLPELNDIPLFQKQRPPPYYKRDYGSEPRNQIQGGQYN